jgi:hypothetical protein
MPVFVTLPSGLILNLGLVRRFAPTDESGRGLSVYFSVDDVMIVGPEDATTLRKRLGATAVASNVKAVIFWLVIVIAIALVCLAISTHH